MNNQLSRKILIVLEVLVGLSEVAGGVGLITGTITFPDTVLQSTPFSSFLIPALVLGLILGGTTLVAAVLLASHHPLGVLVSLAAGCLLIGWVVVQVTMIGYISFLQPLMFSLGALIFVLAAFLVWLPQRQHAL